jgi:hypothetical protein
MKPRFKDSIFIAIKIIIVFMTTIIAFFILKKIFVDVGGMPESFKKVYSESIFSNRGIITPVLFIIFITILFHLLINYIKLNYNIPVSNKTRGLVFGGIYGILWFLGFLELSVVYNSNIYRHLLSAIRDMLTLLVFGAAAGLMFTKKTNKYSIDRKTFLAIPFVGVFFLIMHWAQYGITFHELNQTIDNGWQILYLFCLGSWIGFMYLFLRQSDKNSLWNIFFFAFNLIGVNWILYTSFYLVFLNLPIFDLIIRCLFDLIGITVGVVFVEVLMIRKKHLTIASI